MIRYLAGRRRWSGALVVVALVVTGCRGAEPSQPPSAAATSPGGSAPGITANSIKIGLFAPLSGSAAAFGKAQHMVDAIYQQQNAEGGINGRKLDIVSEDDQCDPTTEQLVLKDLIDRQKVFMLHGGICSDALIAGLPIVKSSGIPLLINSASTGATTDPPLRNVFQPDPTQPDISAQIAAFLKAAAASAGPRIAVVSEQDDWGLGWVNGVKKAITGSALQIVDEEQIARTTGDATAQVQHVIAAKPDFAVVFAYPQPMSVFLRDAYALGLKAPVITGNTTTPDDQVARVGNRPAVMNFFSAWMYKQPVDSHAYDPYRQLLKKYYPQDTFDSNALLAITGALVNIEVLKRMGNDLTWANYIRTMESLHNFDTPVNASAISFAPFDPADPSTRRGAATVTFAHLDPKQSSGSGLVVVSTYADYLKLDQ